MKIVLSVILIVTVASAQHTIPFASTGNRIELSVANTATVDAANVTVELKDAPQWLTFANQKTQISNLKSNEASTTQFTFSVDKSAPINKPYVLKFITSSQTGEKWVKEIAIQVSAPEKFELFQNYPNPFNPSTVISYQLSSISNVTVKVYDVLGKEVATLVNEVKEAGYYSERLDASRLSSGTYIYKITAGKFSETKKMMLMK